MHVVPVPVRSDNYAYLLIDDASKKAAVIDPYDVPKVKAQADKEGVQLSALITTHHHHGMEIPLRVLMVLSKFSQITPEAITHL